MIQVTDGSWGNKYLGSTGMPAYTEEKTMKRLSLLTAIFGVVLSAAGSAGAAKQYLTFEGTVSSVLFDSTGYIAKLGIKSGDPVRYVYAVDTALPGYVYGPEGRRTVDDSLKPGGVRINYFFDSLITRPLLPGGTNAPDERFCFGQIMSYPSLDMFSLLTTFVKGDTTTIVGLGYYLGPAGNFQPISPVPISGSETVQLEDSDKSSVLITSLTLKSVSDAPPASIRFFRNGRPEARLETGWSPAGFRLRNLSGEPLMVRVLDAQGKAGAHFRLSDGTLLSRASLPRGLFLLEVQGAAGTRLGPFVNP